jgi:dTDP-4-amino-4,6-dideoxygalactose transaminase
VIVPSYTYCATALAVLNLGATPVMVDVEAPFHLAIDQVAAAITEKTKAILPVDLGGWPCDYRKILDVLESDSVKIKFRPRGRVQETLNRPLVIADAAHSLGAERNGTRVGGLTDVTIFSFHSVKNLTTGEGGMICLNLPDEFNNDEERTVVRYLSLNGQTKTALEKSTVGGWRYDIVDQGFKANMPDLCAAVGLAQIRQYESKMLPERERIFRAYNEAFEIHSWSILPPMKDANSVSSMHLYQLRIDGIDEECRNQMMRLVAEDGVGVNVHYVPLPMLTLFKRLGYKIEDHPNAFKLYENEITLPVYNGLSEQNTQTASNSVISAFSAAYSKV